MQHVYCPVWGLELREEGVLGMCVVGFICIDKAS